MISERLEECLELCLESCLKTFVRKTVIGILENFWKSG